MFSSRSAVTASPASRAPGDPLRLVAALLLFVALVAAAPQARAGSIVGRATDAASHAPLEGVEVVLRGAADSAVVAHAATAADGRFVLDGVGAGRYLLRLSLLGRVPHVRRDVVVSEGAPALDLGAIALAVAAVPVPGAEVTTARSTVVVAPDRNVYLTRDMPAAGAGSTTDLLRTVPELDVDVDGHVSLRGSAGVNIQINGRASPMKGEALTTFLRQLPANRIERVEVIANPSAKFDPEGAAGIVNIVLKDDVKLGVSGSANAYAGPRYNGLGTRLAWQRGPVTMFGGVGGGLFNWEYGSSSTRTSLLSDPPSVLRTTRDNTSDGNSLSFDTSVDVALDKRTTGYGSVNSSRNHNESDALSRYVFTDSTSNLASRSERTDDGEYSYLTTTFTLGVQHVVAKGRDERSIEFMQSRTGSDNSTDGVQRTFVPADVADQASRRGTATGYRERSLQLDDTHPLGAKGKLEAGARVAERWNTSSGAVAFESGGVPVETPLSARAEYRHRERFHSGYVTVGSTFGKLSVQGGLRGELALTTFDVPTSALHFDRDYRSLFPSANVAWDFGKGRTTRLTYSKRIERPGAGYLNPVVPTNDSLERFVGNPDLGPRYTHSLALDASWSGSRGTLRLSPYFRRTVDNWDVVTTVGTSGAAVSTYRNASSVRTVGASLIGSLRQTGRLGGSCTLGLLQEHHDASNLLNGVRRDVVGWSVNGNVSVKTTSRLDLQCYLRYAPPGTLAQGRTSPYVYSSLGARWKLRESAWASLNVNDPFRLTKQWSETGDLTYRQRTDSNNRMRSISGSLTWTWGKLPEQKQRKQSAEEQAPAEGQQPGR